MKQINPKNNTYLTEAKSRFGNPIKTYDDCMGPLWIYGQEYGPSHIIRAISWEAAYDIAIDESPTISHEDLPEAYGFENQKELNAAASGAEDGINEYPDLEEGYRYQSNASGTGIVNVGHNEWLQELTFEYLKESEIRISIRSDWE